MTDFIKSLQSLDALHKEAESWTSDNIEVTVAASHNSDEPATINLASTLGHNKRISPAKHKKNSNDIYWLPSSLSTGGDNAEFLQTTLVPIFFTSCRNAGFAASSKGSENPCSAFGCGVKEEGSISIILDLFLIRTNKLQSLTRDFTPPVQLKRKPIVLSPFVFAGAPNASGGSCQSSKEATNATVVTSNKHQMN